MTTKPLLGPFVHVNYSQPDYLIKAAEIASKDGGNTFMLYSPVITLRHDFHAPVNLKLFHKYCQRHKIIQDSLVLHAPFMINLANPIDEKVWHFSLHFLRQQLIYCDRIGFKYLVLHPGSHLTGTREQGLNRLIMGLDRLHLNRYNAQVVLETMSGKGNEIGAKFKDFGYILKKVKHPEKIGICLDTCHMNDAGYDLKKWDQVKKEMKKNFSLKKVLVIHLNDSQSPRGSHKDRHENIGYGTIGFENLDKVTWDRDFKKATKILETPYYNGDFAPYQAEIKNFLNHRFTDFKQVK